MEHTDGPMDLGSSTDLEEPYDAPVGSGVGSGRVSAQRPQHSDIGNGVSGTEKAKRASLISFAVFPWVVTWLRYAL